MRTVGEGYAAWAHGRSEWRPLDPLVLEPAREAQLPRVRIHAAEKERVHE